MTTDTAVVTDPAEVDPNPPRRRRALPAWLAFLVVAGVFGAVFAVLTPPFWGHDEISQFGRTYQVAQGGVLPREIDDPRGPAWGGDMPISVDLLMNYALRDYTTQPDDEDTETDEPAPAVAHRAGYPVLERQAVTAERKEIWFTNTAAYSPVPYLPQAVGVRIALALDANVGQLVLAPRLAGLLSYLAIVGFGLWAVRRSRVQWLVFTVAVLPIAVFQAGTVTADTVTNAVALLVSALLVKALFLDRRLTRPETAALLASAIVLPLCKPTYVLLAMLVVLVPATTSGLAGRLRWAPWLCAAIGAAGFLVWTKISAPTTAGMGLMRPRRQWDTVIPGDQLHGILTDPFGFLGTFWESVMRRDLEWFTGFFGQLGFSYVDVPATTILAFLFALAISVGVADRMHTPSRRVSLVVLLAVLATVAMIYVTLYLSFSPVGYYIIDGVQGRYFVPLAVLAFAVLLRRLRVRLHTESGRVAMRGPAIAVVGATVVGLTAAVLKYNLLVWG